MKVRCLLLGHRPDDKGSPIVMCVRCAKVIALRVTRRLR